MRFVFILGGGAGVGCEHVEVDLSHHVDISIKNDTHCTFPLLMTES